MEFDSARCQEAACHRSFLIGRSKATAVAAGPCLTQVDLKENTDCVSSD